MSATIDSRAFQNALLRSERRRIIAVLAFALTAAAVVALRIFAFDAPLNPWSIVALILLAGYEAVVLWRVGVALNSGRQVQPAVWVVSLLTEIAVPALGAAFLVSPRLDLAYRPLASPWVLAFFLFTIASTLRLSSVQCGICGFAAAAGYLAAAAHHGWRIDVAHAARNSATQTTVLVYAALLAGAGLIAAAVATEIRKHVVAALREAETDRKLKQIEHDLQIARSIQQSLLPRSSPRMPGYDIAGWSCPADATGGDYFDWEELPDGRLVLSLADVTGHGIGPALLAAICRSYARAAFKAPDDLRTTLERINSLLAQDLTPGRFATLVAAVCKRGEPNVEVLSAGHGPLFVYSASNQSLRSFNAQALPLGIMPELNATASELVELEAGDVLLLITDGFLEWENARGEDFGVEGLRAVLRQHGHLPADQIIAELYRAVIKFAGGTRQADDLTAVVVKRVAAGDAAVVAA